MSEKQKFYISDLSYSDHIFHTYHFCRGNGNRRKSRFGLIEKGSGTYMYLNKKLEVQEGDVVFIPERIFCYSEWRGEPDIKVTYISCFMHYDMGYFEYEPQKLNSDADIWQTMLQIRRLLSGSFTDTLEAYSLFYKLLLDFLPNMVQSRVYMDKTIQKALDYITNHWNEDFSIADVAKECCISESKLYHVFKDQLGQTPVSFLNSIKINYAIQYLENSDCSISQISQLVNFKSENHFRKVFFEVTGSKPLQYKKQYPK